MKTLPLSAAAAGLFRALMARAGADRDRFLLRAVESSDWQSLTFTGERHRMSFRINADGADALARRFASGLGEFEFAIPGHIVADIEAKLQPIAAGSVGLVIEALTIED